VHRVVDDNNNRYRSMIINVMRTNQSDASECSIIDEKPNANINSFFFFNLLKASNKPL
jgi:hypothetical protein